MKRFLPSLAAPLGLAAAFAGVSAVVADDFQLRPATAGDLKAAMTACFALARGEASPPPTEMLGPALVVLEPRGDNFRDGGACTFAAAVPFKQAQAAMHAVLAARPERFAPAPFRLQKHDSMMAEEVFCSSAGPKRLIVRLYLAESEDGPFAGGNIMQTPDIDPECRP